MWITVCMSSGTMERQLKPMRIGLAGWLVSVALLAAGCTHASSVEPSAPTPPTPTNATCPSPITAQSTNGQPIRVTFADPRASAAVQPASFACTPASGDAFSVGTTTVACAITDARQQTFSCSFTVKVVGPPRLSATTFLAFGDSLTSGSSPPDPIDSYPPRLKAQLAARYAFQTIVVINDGRAGENASATGRTRLPVALDLYKPGALILMEGSNDLLGGSAGATAALNALTEMMRAARGRGITVFLATLPPQRLGGVRNGVALMIPGFNENIKALAQREGATLVDIYTAMGGDGRYIGHDDLHPTPEGFEVMARAFAAAIVEKLEITD
jgi:lysophospholipase L1-like esterase